MITKKIKDLTDEEIKNNKGMIRKKYKEVKLGIYNGTPIEWLILNENENEYLLLSKYILELRRFDEISNNYEKSEIKDFLENYMLSRIGTFDNLFLLSKEEVEKYLPKENDRIACFEPNKYGKDISYWWWLRSSPYSSTSSTYVVQRSDGSIYSTNVSPTDFGVRPACWIKKELLEDKIDISDIPDDISYEEYMEVVCENEKLKNIILELNKKLYSNK